MRARPRSLGFEREYNLNWWALFWLENAPLDGARARFSVCGVYLLAQKCVRKSNFGNQHPEIAGDCAPFEGFFEGFGVVWGWLIFKISMFSVAGIEHVDRSPCNSTDENRYITSLR